MQKLVIDGGRPLSGEIKVQGAKNAVLPVLAACTLCSREVRLSNAPASPTDTALHVSLPALAERSVPTEQT